MATTGCARPLGKRRVQVWRHQASSVHSPVLRRSRQVCACPCSQPHRARLPPPFPTRRCSSSRQRGRRPGWEALPRWQTKEQRAGGLGGRPSCSVASETEVPDEGPKLTHSELCCGASRPSPKRPRACAEPLPRPATELDASVTEGKWPAWAGQGGFTAVHSLTHATERRGTSIPGQGQAPPPTAFS